MNNEIKISKRSFNMYQKRLNFLRSLSRISSDVLVSEFQDVMTELEKEYRNGYIPYLTISIINTCVVNPDAIEYWDTYLYNILAHSELNLMDNPEFNMRKKIIENFNFAVPLSKRSEIFQLLYKDMLKLHQMYLAPEKNLSSEEKETADLNADIESLRQQKNDLEEEIKNKKLSVQKELEEYRQKQQTLIDEEIESEKEKILDEFRKNPDYLLRFQESEQHNQEVRQMVQDRRQMEQRLADEMNQTSRSFRDRTEEVTSAIRSILQESLNKIKESTQEEISRIETHTENAINSVADINRKLQNDDFRNLFQGYQRLEENLYYRSRSGTHTEEYQTYWKSVSAYLKNFEKTLNKLGYLRIYPEIGSVLDPETMEIFEDALDDDLDFPANDSEFEEFIVKAVVSSGFRSGEDNSVEEKAKVIPEKSPFRKDVN